VGKTPQTEAKQMNKPITKINYAKTLRDIRAIIERGRMSALEAVQRQVLVTNWEVGRIITIKLLPDSGPGPSAGNARVIRQLSADLGRPRSFIYNLVKVYKCYPQLPGPESSLTWSHYMSLVSIENEYMRRTFEQRTIKQGVSSKNLYQLISRKRAKKSAVILSGTDSRHSGNAKRIKNLSVTRGELYFYRCVRRACIPLKKNERRVDVGFKVLRKTKTPAWKSQSHTLHIRSYKKDGAYNLRIARPDDSKLYTYVAAVERVIDGDTIELNIDLGFDSWIKEKVRLRGIDTPEQTTNLGKAAKKYVQDQLNKVKFVVCKTYWDDKYGRMLVDLFYSPKEKDPAVVAEKGIFLNQQLLNEGLALPYNG
jgi:endonuclease YncB( thermonuclease family)